MPGLVEISIEIVSSIFDKFHSESIALIEKNSKRKFWWMGDIVE